MSKYQYSVEWHRYGEGGCSGGNLGDYNTVEEAFAMAESIENDCFHPYNGDEILVIVNKIP